MDRYGQDELFLETNPKKGVRLSRRQTVNTTSDAQVRFQQKQISSFEQIQEKQAKNFNFSTGPMNDSDRVRALMDQGFTRGLSTTFLGSSKLFALRIWVVDNSGSMVTTDGHRLVSTEVRSSKNRRKNLELGPAEQHDSTCCSRWEELCDAVHYHANMAATLNSPTIFRFLNEPGEDVGPQQFSIAQDGPEYIEEDIKLMRKILRRAQPGGVTPLTKHIKEIREGLSLMKADLIRSGQKACIILATDGLPTDEEGYGGPDITNEFVASLKSLEGFPVWLVIRLCTDEPQVCKFYNDLDGQLEYSLEVLDDFFEEASEVNGKNNWLTYGYPLHRLRELGFNNRVLDMIDERPLTKGEIVHLCKILFGVSSLPDPAIEWTSFVRAIDSLQKKEKKVWNPVKNKLSSWIDLKKMHQEHGDGSACILM